MGLVRAPRDVFPSLHVGLSAVVLWYAWKHGKTAFLLLLPFVAGNWISTLYLRYHYLIDVLVGFVVAFLGVLLARAALRLERRLQTTYAIANPIWAAILIRYMCRHDGKFSADL